MIHFLGILQPDERPAANGQKAVFGGAPPRETGEFGFSRLERDAAFLNLNWFGIDGRRSEDTERPRFVQMVMPLYL